MGSSDDDMIPDNNPQDSDKEPDRRRPHRVPVMLWPLATTRGRRVTLGVLLAVLVGLGALIIRRQGLFGSGQVTMAVWLAFVLVLVLIFAVTLLEMMVIRVKFRVAQRDLVRNVIVEAQQQQQSETDPPSDNKSDTAARGGQIS